jgi:two-component system, chemotaxis family, sensor kinase CheA
MIDSPDRFIEDIEALIGRLACEAVLDPAAAGLDDWRASLESLAALLRETGEAPLEALGSTVAEGARSLTEADERAPLLSTIDAAWNAWRVGRAVPATPAPSVCAPEDDPELEMLRMDPEIAGMFTAEALDHLGAIEATVLQLEATPGDQKLLNDVFRPFHTIKGNAGALGVTSVQEFAHKVENLLDLGRSGQIVVGPPEIDVILRAVDLLTTMITGLTGALAGQPRPDVSAEVAALVTTVGRLATEGRAAKASADAQPSATPADTEAHARATEPAAPAPAIELQGGGESLALAARPPAAATAPAAGPVAPRRSAEELAGQASVKVDTRKLDNLVDMVGELVIVQSIIHADPALVGMADERLSRNLAQLRRITSDLQRNAMSMRMVPIRQTFQKMARLVRDLGKKSDKVVELVLSGEDTELDRKVVEDINDPLMHMIRNAVDHGLEPPDARLAAGKPPVGRLSLSAYHQGGNIVIAIGDDGRGLDADRILAKAVVQGLVAPGETLQPADIYPLIFRPGFSTAEKVTEISGRGVGMDVVRRNIDALRGRVDIQTTLGAGTTFFIKLPLTLAIVEGLMLKVGQERFVLPTFAVRESLRPRADQVHTVQGQPRMLQVRDSLVPLVRLGDLFEVADATTDACRGTVVVIEDDGRQVGLLVDQLLGKQEVVIKPLGRAFSHLRGVAGGAILGDGRVGLILDASGILQLSGHQNSGKAA